MANWPAIVSVLVLFVNDHVLKKAWPGLVTGKISDIAGMIFFPLLLTELLRFRARDRVLLVACVATALVFALTKTTTFANEAYAVTWGAMQWPAHALWALAHGRAIPQLGRAVLMRDPTDLVAVPFVLVAWRYGRNEARRAVS